MNNLSIYLDEYGTTGGNLLDPEQPWFSYASVALTDEDIDFFSNLVKSHGIKMVEMKGQKVFRRIRKGSENYKRFAISFSEHFSKKSIVYLSEKKFSFCGKVFEYLFEPLVTEFNSLFYENKFHVVMANILYFDLFCMQDPLAETFKKCFLASMKRKEPDLFFCDELLEAVYRYFSGESNLLVLPIFCDLALRGQDYIRHQFSQMRPERYYLDLSETSLTVIMAQYHELHGELDLFIDRTVYLDNSVLDNWKKGLRANYVDSEGQTHSKLLKLNDYQYIDDSSQSLGIQIADLIARLSGYLFENKDSDFMQAVDFENMFQCGGLIPELHYVQNPHNNDTQKNMNALVKLATRVQNGIPIDTNLQEYYGYLPNRVYDIFSEVIQPYP